MGTHSVYVRRYRFKYYRILRKWNGGPCGVGKEVANTIPADPKQYSSYLEQAKAKLEYRANLYLPYLCRHRRDYINDDGEMTVNNDSSTCHCGVPWPEASGIDAPLDEELENAEVGTVPRFVPSIGDDGISFAYTINYDNETYSVLDTCYLRLNQVPHVDWYKALTEDGDGMYVFDTNLLPSNVATGIALPPPPISSNLVEQFETLDVKEVKAQSLSSFPVLQRQFPLVQIALFKMARRYLIRLLPSTLLSWNIDELPFREVAFACLCLASANHTELVRSDNIKVDRYAAFSNLFPCQCCSSSSSNKPEFLPHMWTGSHLQGNEPGSAPAETTYWFEGVLVHLVARLDRPDAVREAIAFVRMRCRSERPHTVSRCLLFSVEHIVFVQVYPNDRRVDRTEVMTLFELYPHRTLDPTEYERCEGSPWRQSLVEDRGADTFNCLIRFLDIGARQAMPPTRAYEGSLPFELYQKILSHINDLDTFRACMRVSRLFRSFCLERPRVGQGLFALSGEQPRSRALKSLREAASAEGSDTQYVDESTADEEFADMNILEHSNAYGFYAIYIRSYTPRVLLQWNSHQIERKIVSTDPAGESHSTHAGGVALDHMRNLDDKILPGLDLYDKYTWMVVIGDERHRRTLLPRVSVTWSGLRDKRFFEMSVRWSYEY